MCEDSAFCSRSKCWVGADMKVVCAIIKLWQRNVFTNISDHFASRFVWHVLLRSYGTLIVMFYNCLNAQCLLIVYGVLYLLLSLFCCCAVVHTLVIKGLNVLLWCFLRAKATAALACLNHRNFVRPSVTWVDQSKTVQAMITKSSPLAAWKTLFSGTVKLFHKFERSHLERGR